MREYGFAVHEAHGDPRRSAFELDPIHVVIGNFA
jgi:hypothetical protein